MVGNAKTGSGRLRSRRGGTDGKTTKVTLKEWGRLEGVKKIFEKATQFKKLPQEEEGMGPILGQEPLKKRRFNLIVNIKGGGGVGVLQYIERYIEERGHGSKRDPSAARGTVLGGFDVRGVGKGIHTGISGTGWFDLHKASSRGKKTIKKKKKWTRGTKDPENG